jgi:predicted metallopeptidase
MISDALAKLDGFLSRKPNHLYPAVLAAAVLSVTKDIIPVLKLPPVYVIELIRPSASQTIE